MTLNSIMFKASVNILITDKSTEIEVVWLPLHVSVYISLHLILFDLASPVSPSTTARHWSAALRSGETRGETQVHYRINTQGYHSK